MDDSARQMFEMLLEDKMLQKVHMSVDLMGEEAADRPDEMIFTKSKKLRDNQIILELNGMEAADFLKQPLIMKLFLTRFHSPTAYQLSGLPVLVENVPISFNPAAKEEVENTEQRNNLPKGAIIAAKYIKEIEQ